jgi:DNA-binding NarL/FixJ family response regulator
MRVVIAEDLLLLREGLARLLDEMGWTVVSAVDDPDALLEAIEQHRPDVAIVDIRLPPTYRDEGLRAAIEARRRSPGTPILILSQYIERTYVRELLADSRGGVGYLLKDRVSDVRQFMTDLRAVAAGGTVLDPQVVRAVFDRLAKTAPQAELTPREREVLGPGVAGARWLTSNVSFPTVNGERVAQLAASTDGSAAGTTHSEMYQNRLRFFEGTYASRVRFTDAPDSGTDGDHVNETYFTISPLRYDRDPLYSELDFSEYLPNGGWGGSTANYQTSWYTYWNNPTWDGLRTSTAQNRSFNGWHDIVTQVSGGHVKYYLDGQLTADHTTDAQGNPVYPRTPMSINYNMWFIDTAGHTSGNSVYTEQVDWTYYAGNEVVSPSDAVARAGPYRTARTSHVDTVDDCAASE